MSKQPMRGRMIRVSDKLWAAAQKRADEKGETVSEAVRKFLERYVRLMGAYKVEVMLHDVELEEFVRQALADELTPEARYVAERMCDEVPELRPR